MTEYLDHCEDAFIPCVLHKSALRYILEEFHEKPDLTNIEYPEGCVGGNGEKIIQLMFDKSKIKMRMYGSAKELAENIKIYKNFPMSHRYFNAELYPCFTTPIIYENLKRDQKFICKSDEFIIIQSIALRTFEEEDCPLAKLTVPYFLKSQEKLDENISFVPFDRKVFDEIWKDFQKVLRKYEHHVQNDRSFANLEDELWGLGTDQLLAKLKSFVPNTWDTDECGRISQILWLMQLCSNDVDIDSAKGAMAELFIMSKYIVEELQEIVKKRPELFKNQTQTVRVFEDGDKEFVMKAELFNVLKIQYEDPNNTFDTISFKDALGAYKEKLSNIEFIRYPIQRAKHRAVPINGYDQEYPDEYCILALDALFDFLRSLILGYKIFQKFPDANWIPFFNFFNVLERNFNPDYETPYFLQENATKFTNSLMKTNFTDVAIIPTKTVRNAKADGFKVQNLKSELAYLNLTVAFPEIQDHAEVVYAYVDKVKKEKYLRTCDLIDAVEMCQLICIFERLPNYKKFLHNQGGCGRVPGLTCDFCDEKKKKDEDQKDALKLVGSEISAVESSESQITLKTVTSSENSDFKSGEVQKITMGAPDSQLTELNTKIASLEAQLASQAEKSTQLESDLPIVTSSTSLIECIICHIDIFNTQNTIKCPNCRTRFHKECALNYSKDHKECPSCEETMKESAICLN